MAVCVQSIYAKGVIDDMDREIALHLVNAVQVATNRTTSVFEENFQEEMYMK
jgi:hypothetical protein